MGFVLEWQVRSSGLASTNIGDWRGLSLRIFAFRRFARQMLGSRTTPWSYELAQCTFFEALSGGLICRRYSLVFTKWLSLEVAVVEHLAMSCNYSFTGARDLWVLVWYVWSMDKNEGNLFKTAGTLFQNIPCECSSLSALVLFAGLLLPHMNMSGNPNRTCRLPMQNRESL